MTLGGPLLTNNYHKQHANEATSQFSVIIKPLACFYSQPSPCGSTRKFKQDNISCDRGLGNSRPRVVCLNKKDAKSWHRAKTAAWEVFVKLFPGAHAKWMPAAQTKRQIPSNVLYPVTPEAGSQNCHKWASSFCGPEDILEEMWRLWRLDNLSYLMHAFKWVTIVSRHSFESVALSMEFIYRSSVIMWSREQVSALYKPRCLILEVNASHHVWLAAVWWLPVWSCALLIHYFVFILWWYFFQHRILFILNSRWWFAAASVCEQKQLFLFLCYYGTLYCCCCGHYYFRIPHTYT